MFKLTPKAEIELEAAKDLFGFGDMPPPTDAILQDMLDAGLVPLAVIQLGQKAGQEGIR